VNHEARRDFELDLLPSSTVPKDHRGRPKYPSSTLTGNTGSGIDIWNGAGPPSHSGERFRWLHVP
jgi:hypothetical protein